MKRRLTLAAVTAAALAGACGSFLAARALLRAIDESQTLYRVDTAGSQIESDLEYETQESRRAFLYALAVDDPNQQLPFIDEARQASDRVEQTAARMRSIQWPEIEGWVNEFERSWKTYGDARDEIVADILEGDTAASIVAERVRGQPAFNAALRDLHALKFTLAQHAQVASAEVDRTLKKCAASLAAFLLSTVLIITLLSKVNRDRLMALASLNASNEALDAERELEKRRASILEMVSTQAPLARTLGAIADLASRGIPGAGAAIWVATDSVLHFQASAGLPRELTHAMEQHPIPAEREDSICIAELDLLSRTRAGQFNLSAAEPRPLLDPSRRLMGILQVYVPETAPAAERLELDRSLADQMAQLAAVAIENSLLYERLAFQAQHDMLTELPNRLLFQDRVQQGIQLARRHGKKIAVTWIDLDRYKQINDSLGHRAGDQVLCEVGRHLKSCLRESDTVARMGGDEFIVLAHDISGYADAEAVASKLLNAISLPMAIGEHELVITASAGISLFPEHGEDPGTLLRNADLAMYGAKRLGGNRSHVFQPALGDAMQRRIEIERCLKDALERGEFFLEYQPLIDGNDHLESLEVLLRWKSATLGRVAPSEFIPVAEEMGLIVPIGEWVIRTACAQGVSWQQAGLEVPRLAVNASSIQFLDQGFGAMVEQAARYYQFPLSKLEIEITESVLMKHLDRAAKQIASLRRLGVRFAIDDFGTGFSSLGQLRTLPVNCVKIDRSFISGLDASETGSTTLVRGIIALAHNLQLDVVAEGVETKEQLFLLRAMGCDACQGFFLHRPMPPHAARELLLPCREGILECA